MPKSVLNLWRYAPFTGECTCTSSSTIPGQDARWEEVSVIQVDPGAFSDSQSAQDAVDAIKDGYTDPMRATGGVTGGSGEFGYTITIEQFYPATEPTVFEGMSDPFCPQHGTPEPSTDPPEPPADQTEDELTIKLEIPGTGTGGNDAGNDGGGDSGGEGMLGQGGAPAQYPPPPMGPDADEDDVLGLPMGWTWDLGKTAAGSAAGTMSLITDLSETNPLNLAKFTTLAAQSGALAVTAMSGLPAGQTGWQVQGTDTPTVRLEVVQLAVGELEVRRYVQVDGVMETTPGVTQNFKFVTDGGLPAVQLTETPAVGTPKISVFAGQMGGGGGRAWHMRQPNGTVREGTESAWASNTQTIEESEHAEAGALFVRRTVTTRVKKSWGVEVTQESVYDSEAVGAVPVVTTYTYYDDPGLPKSHGKLKWRTCTDGTWDRYDYLESGVTRSYRPWKDGPEGPADATFVNSRITESSEDGQTVTEIIEGNTVLVTQSHTAPGSHPNFSGVPTPQPPPENPEGTPVYPPEYVGSNLLDAYQIHTTSRMAEGKQLQTMSWVNQRTGRTDGMLDESGVMTVYEEFPATLTVGGMDVPVIRRTRSLQGRAPMTTTLFSALPQPETEYVDADGRVLKKEAELSTTIYTYDGRSSQVTEVEQDGETVYEREVSTDEDDNRVVVETDAQGGKTRTITSPQGKMLSRSKLALDGTTALITTTTSVAGLTRTTTTTGGGLTRSSTMTTDAQGRTVQQVDEEGVTTNYAYEDFGRTMIEKDVAGNVLRTTRQYLDGQSKSVTGAAGVAEYHDYVVDAVGRTTHTVRYGTETGTTYRKQVTDGAGLLHQEIEPPQDGGADEKVTMHTYDLYGRRERTQVTGMAPVRILYDGLSRVAGQRVLLGSGGMESANDPLTTRQIQREYMTENGEDNSLWLVTRTWQAVDGNEAHDLPTEQREKISTGQGRVSMTTTADGTQLTETTTVNRASATVTTTLSSNRATNTAVRVVVNGLLQSETGLNATAATTYTYDGLERVSTLTTPEGVVHKTLYDDTTGGVARQRVKEQQLKPAGGSAFITQASYAYYPLGAAREGLLHTLTNAEGATTIYTHDAAGRVLTQTGTASYPLRYDYDAQGRLWKLHTYRGASPDLEEDGDVTTWNYDPASGRLVSKRDAANKGASYTYTPAGLLHTRTWQRGIVTTYGYDGAGRLKSIDYDDSTTPDVTYAYDRAGRRVNVTDAAGTHTLTYAGTQADTWTVAAGSGPWAGLSVDYGITAGRRTGRTTSQGGITLPAVSYAYTDVTGELGSVTSGDIAATYSRTAATGWNEGVTYTVGSSTKLKSTRTADARGRLDAISWADGANAVLSGHDYTLDEMNRRTHALRQDGSQWVYGYNLRGEVTSAAKEDATEIPEPGKQFAYAFDGLGNRTSSTVSSLSDHEVKRSTGYATNALNQYTQISHPSPGWLVQRGSAKTEATVSIDGEAPTLRFGENWHDEKSVDNSAGAVRQVTEITATRPTGGVNNSPVTARQKGSRFIPPPVETITHDDDGNQTTNAQWTYTWDGENRLMAAEESQAVLLQPTVATSVKRRRLEFTYDSQGRRISKRVLLAESGSTTFVLKQGIVFLYDGWNMIAEIDITQSQSKLLRSCEWGADISGNFTGAGGVGGLLIQRFYNGGTPGAPIETYSPCYDGNGNVTAIVSLADGSVSGRYEYGPFGEPISVYGSVAESNPHRFSTKYWDEEFRVYHYTYRYYDSQNGRWLSRDPVEEQGGPNLFPILQNDPINKVDFLGLEWCIGESFQGQRGTYRGNFASSNTKDRLDKLKQLVPGSAAVKAKLVQGAKTRTVDARSYLNALEDELRTKVVNLALEFQKRGTPFGPPDNGIKPPSFTPAQVNAFFNPSFPAAKCRTIDCYVAIHVIMAKAAQEFMGAAYSGLGYESAHFYKQQKGLVPQQDVNTGSSMFLGDWGYINGYEAHVQQNPQGAMGWSPANDNPATTGENVIKTGNNSFYGFFTGGGENHSQEAWTKTLEGGGLAPQFNNAPTRVGRVSDVYFINIPLLTMQTFLYNLQAK